MKIETSVILCAGNGARMRPLTNFYPKSFLPVKDKLALEIVVFEAVKSGAKKIVFVINKGDNFVAKFANWFEEKYKYGINFTFCEQKEKNGSGGALLVCQDVINEPFFLAFADDLTKSKVPVLKQLEKVFSKTGKSVMATRLVEKSQAQNYGILKYTKFLGNIIGFCGIVEKPETPFEQNFANFGRYVLTPEIFDVLKTVPKEKSGEIYLTKAFEALALEDKMVACSFEGKCFDIGTMENYINAFKRY